LESRTGWALLHVSAPRSTTDTSPHVRRMREGISRSVEGATHPSSYIGEAPGVLLSYPLFDTDPHPPLASCVRSTFRLSGLLCANYSTTRNPPILHERTVRSGGLQVTREVCSLTSQKRGRNYTDGKMIGLAMDGLPLASAKVSHTVGHRLVASAMGSPRSSGGSVRRSRIWPCPRSGNPWAP